MSDAPSNGYLHAKLEAIESRLEQMCGHMERQASEHAALKSQIAEYTAQWRAARWVGALVIALIVVLKTGNWTPLKALVGL